MSLCYLGWGLAILLFIALTWLFSKPYGLKCVLIVYASCAVLISLIILIIWLIAGHCSTCTSLNIISNTQHAMETIYVSYQNL